MKLLIDFLLVAGIVVNVIIIALFYSVKKREIHQNILILIFFIFLFFLVSGYGIFHQVKWLQYLAITFEGIYFLIGPLIYLYVMSLKKHEKHTLTKNWKHFIPFAFYFSIITVPILISAYEREYIYQYLAVINEHSYVKNVVELLFTIIYTILALQLLNSYSNEIKNQYSQLDYKNIRWIKLLAIGSLIISTINVFVSSIEPIIGSNELLDFVFVVSFVIFVFYLGYYGLHQKKIEVSKNNENTGNIKLRSYANENEIETLAKLLKTKFAELKPFLDEDLTLAKLAEFFETTDKKLSYFLNSHLRTNFYDFINKQRVKEFKNRLRLDAHSDFSLLGIAHDCGFKSKSSFNRVFKKETGMSPSEYKKSLAK